ncbi:hypothetical protein [Microcoleus sp. CAWBG640]|uniref:hypothetical protein n=1 Tax=Microcoleus sp. CAWBG640 TaxID=2841653 RepID=UPI00312BCB8C
MVQLIVPVLLVKERQTHFPAFCWLEQKDRVWRSPESWVLLKLIPLIEQCWN